MTEYAPLPEPLESELLQLLFEPEAGFWPGVARLCQRHPGRSEDIRREAERLHAAAAEESARASTHAPSTRPDADADTKKGDRIGSFTVLEEIGHGGMGDVFLAEQREPVRRRVALKVIRLGLDTKAMLARFEVERQALAMMDHSHIAKVFEAGATSKGRPYFAMEYVKGVPITRYCDENKLSLEDRLALFKQVCSGVQHAHTKGVIHRDLTPNNVLVTLQDGKPTAKIIDFGLARATDQRLTEKTLFTAQGVILGTPEYMSPEQAGLNALDIDMRTDVYTLGVLLYELLTGRLPFDGKELRAGGYDAMCKTIREAEPPRPSTRVTMHHGGTDGAAKLRRTDASTLLRRLRGDLDWVVLKCLEKDRTRRYETVSALADDVERHLASEPVLARAPSAAYRLAKFGRRYRGQVVAATAVLLALVGGLGVALYFWRDAVAQATAVERSANLLADKVREFDQLAGVVHLERLQKTLEDLAVPWQDLAPARRWLADADRILAMRPALTKTVADLRARALPATSEELALDRATHPRWVEWQKLNSRLQALEQPQAREGDTTRVLPELTAHEEAMGPDDLNSLAWPLVDPAEHAGKQVHAARALVLARLAWAKAEAAGAKGCDLADTLAWALFWNGRDEEAVRQSELALQRAPESRKEEYRQSLSDLRTRIAAGEGKAAIRAHAEFASIEAARLRTEVRDLDAVIGERRTYRFEAEAHRFLHDALVVLLADIEVFERAECADVRRRVRCAELTTSHPNARATWQQARDAIARADGVGASTLYREHPIELRPQLGLVPIGMNPVTKLWEFYELHSAWDQATISDPLAVELPEHDPDGRVTVGDGTGIVFVLLPGATFTMGAQGTNRGGLNHDPDAQLDEGPPHSVTLAPFFVARHELTQGQWLRLGGKRDQRLLATGGAYPIADVDWHRCDALLRSHGLSLPTEAQWEYGCRATTTTPWWTGVDPASLGEDVKAPRFQPVGSGRSNPFGLFDVHGNVTEWCADWKGEYLASWRMGDGLRLVEPDSATFRVTRGGMFNSEARFARSAYRDVPVSPTFRIVFLGVRAARSLVSDI